MIENTPFCFKHRPTEEKKEELGLQSDNSSLEASWVKRRRLVLQYLTHIGLLSDIAQLVDDKVGKDFDGSSEQLTGLAATELSTDR